MVSTWLYPQEELSIVKVHHLLQGTKLVSVDVSTCLSQALLQVDAESEPELFSALQASLSSAVSCMTRSVRLSLVACRVQAR